MDHDGLTKLGLEEGPKVFAEQITLSGKGKLSSCIVTFIRHDGPHLCQMELLFLKPLHAKTETLLPHIKNFVISEYDFCSVMVFTGNVLPGDEIVLHLATLKTGA